MGETGGSRHVISFGGHMKLNNCWTPSFLQHRKMSLEEGLCEDFLHVFDLGGFAFGNSISHKIYCIHCKPCRLEWGCLDVLILCSIEIRCGVGGSCHWLHFELGWRIMPSQEMLPYGCQGERCTAQDMKMCCAGVISRALIHNDESNSSDVLAL